MKRNRLTRRVLVLILTIASGRTAFGQVGTPGEPLSLWYLQPAREWVEALPIGNGRLGGMISGGIALTPLGCFPGRGDHSLRHAGFVCRDEKVARWTWRFNDGTSFLGNEQNLWTPDLALLVRGAIDTSAGSFVAGRWVTGSDASQGTVIFHGIPGIEGDTEVINGTRTTLNKDGVVTGTVLFKATRLH